MAWVNDPGSAYIDHWDAELTGKRWYRKLDRDSAAYLYRYEQMEPAHSVLFGPADAVGLPEGLDNAGFLITDATGQALYQNALSLTADLAGVVADTGQHVNGMHAAAVRLAEAVNESLGEASARPGQIKDEQTAAERSQLLRQGLRYLMDAAGQVHNWATNTVAIGAPYRNRMCGIAARINAIVNPLYQALQ
jgi:hypothetical protein